MEIRNLRAFAAICDTGSFSGAATILGYAQSSITMQIKQLEGELDARLFERIGRRVRLTESGEQLLEYARDILAKTDDIVLTLTRPSSHGTVRIGVMESLGVAFMPDVLAQFYRDYPETRVKLALGSSHELREMLNENTVDFIWAFDSEEHSASLITGAKISHSLALVCGAQSSLSERPLPPQALGEERFIFSEPGCIYRNALQSFLYRYDTGLNVFMEVPSTEIICRLVSRGIGVSFMPEFLVRPYIERGELSTFSVEGFEPCMDSVLLHHRSKSLSSGARLLLEYIAGEVS